VVGQFENSAHAALEVEPGEFFEGIKWESGDIRLGRFKPDDTATL
jgi:hypothetical protein